MFVLNAATWLIFEIDKDLALEILLADVVAYANLVELLKELRKKLAEKPILQ